MINDNEIKFKKKKLDYLRWYNPGGFLCRLFGPLLKTGLPLIKIAIKPLAKSVLIPLGLTAAASAADAGIHKKILESGHNNNNNNNSNNNNNNNNNNTTLIISKDEINDIIKIVTSLEDSGLLLKGVTETVIRYIRCKFIRKSFNWKGNI